VLREGLCAAGCGCKVTIVTTPRVSCSECRIERKRASARAAMEKQRRKKGVAEVKGSILSCEDCGGQFTLNRSLRKTRCNDCQLEHRRAAARAKSAAMFATAEGKEYHRRYQAERGRTDLAYRLNRNMRSHIWASLRGRKHRRRWESLVGYTLSDLMQHLERQFVRGMSWDNRHLWHIDHIVPLSSFQFTTPDCEGFKAAWALTNLRPLWSGDNLRKSARRTHLL
jgi:hypothetical protein